MRLSLTNNRSWWTVMPFARGRSSRSTRVRPLASRTLTLPSMTSVAKRLPALSNATSSGAMISPPFGLMVSTCPSEVQSADLAARHLGDIDAAVRAGA